MPPTENSDVRVVDGPVRVDGGICRLVELADGSGRVESWVNGRWVPGGATVKGVLMGTPVADPEGGGAAPAGGAGPTDTATAGASGETPPVAPLTK